MSRRKAKDDEPTWMINMIGDEGPMDLHEASEPTPALAATLI